MSKFILINRWESSPSTGKIEEHSGVVSNFTDLTIEQIQASLEPKD